MIDPVACHYRKEEGTYMLSKILMTAMELIGTVAFAVSGSLVAISCSLDLFGVLIIGCITAVGGGIMRDILIQNLPPNIFSNLGVLALAVLTSLVVFCIAYIKRKSFVELKEKIDHINNIFDALGLAAFSVTGVGVAVSSAHGDNIVLAVTLGMLTGVGGGVLRDVLVNEKPYILTKHIYAVASILGSILYYAVSVYMNRQVLGAILAYFVTVAIRLLAAKYHWNLPKIRFTDGKK